MSEYLGYFGFGQNLALDISEARRGILPTREWKRAFKGRSWYPGDSINMGIGQGYMLATPLQLATATSILAVEGTLGSDGEVIHAPAPRMLKQTGDRSIVLSQRSVDMPEMPVMDDSHWALVRDSMVDVMHSAKGTARSSGRNADYLIAGKTGTAQVVGIAQGEEYDAEALDERHRDHALFVGYAPADNPEIAVAVIVENGGGGGSTAAPIARAMFDSWLIELEHPEPQEFSKVYPQTSNDVSNIKEPSPHG